MIDDASYSLLRWAHATTIATIWHTFCRLSHCVETPFWLWGTTFFFILTCHRNLYCRVVACRNVNIYIVASPACINLFLILPCAVCRLREVFMKTDNHIGGKYFAKLIKERSPAGIQQCNTSIVHTYCTSYTLHRLYSVHMHSTLFSIGL